MARVFQSSRYRVGMVGYGLRLKPFHMPLSNSSMNQNIFGVATLSSRNKSSLMKKSSKLKSKSKSKSKDLGLERESSLTKAEKLRRDIEYIDKIQAKVGWNSKEQRQEGQELTKEEVYQQLVTDDINMMNDIKNDNDTIGNREFQSVEEEKKEIQDLALIIFEAKNAARQAAMKVIMPDVEGATQRILTALKKTKDKKALDEIKNDILPTLKATVEIALARKPMVNLMTDDLADPMEDTFAAERQQQQQQEIEQQQQLEQQHQLEIAQENTKKKSKKLRKKAY